MMTFLAGMMVGAPVGFLGFALCAIAKQSDNDYRHDFRQGSS